mgnify:CR=1 FL=1
MLIPTFAKDLILSLTYKKGTHRPLLIPSPLPGRGQLSPSDPLAPPGGSGVLDPVIVRTGNKSLGTN